MSTAFKREPLQAPVAGFEHINRFVDRRNGNIMAKILPGEYYVTNQDEVIATVLGSCISACIRDKHFRIGGMNHFMLPESQPGETSNVEEVGLSSATRYGAAAMEYLINSLIKLGAHRKNLEIKLVGGGKVMTALSDIGDRNILFVRRYLQQEGFEIAGEDVGDIYPRKVLYDPLTGRVKVRKLKDKHNETIEERESKYRKSIEVEPPAGDIELF